MGVFFFEVSFGVISGSSFQLESQDQLMFFVRLLVIDVVIGEED